MSPKCKGDPILDWHSTSWKMCSSAPCLFAPRPRCMTARDRLRAWDVNFFGSSNLTHKICGIFVASWGFAHCRYWYQAGIPQFFHLNIRRTNGAMQKTHKVLKMRLLTFTLAAFIRGSLEPQRLLIQIWRSSVTDAGKQSDKS